MLVGTAADRRPASKSRSGAVGLQTRLEIGQAWAQRAADVALQLGRGLVQIDPQLLY